MNLGLGTPRLSAILGILLFSQAASSVAQAGEDYQWRQVFVPGIEATYKDCEFLQKQVADHARQRSEAHQRCLSNTRLDNCPDHPASGCTCVHCARWHGPDEYMERNLHVCMETARANAERKRQFEARQQEVNQKAEDSRKQAERQTQDTWDAIRQSQERRHVERQQAGDEAGLPAPDYDPLRPWLGSQEPESEFPSGSQPALGSTPQPSSDGASIADSMPAFDDLLRRSGQDMAVTSGPEGGAPQAPLDGPSIASAMPAFDDLLRRSGQDLAASLGPEVVQSWDPALGTSIEKTEEIAGVAERVATWTTFASSLGEESAWGAVDRVRFVVGELADQALTAPSSFAFSLSSESLQQVASDARNRFDLAWRAFDGEVEDPWSAIDRASDFNSLGILIGSSMCSWCGRAIAYESAARVSWDRFRGFLGLDP